MTAGGCSMGAPDSPRQVVLRALLRVLKPGRCIDLGCNRCVLADDLAAAGWDVTPTDCVDYYVPGMWRNRFKRIKVQDVDVTGFDLILFAGLCYHLDAPTQISVCRKFRGTPVLMDTYRQAGTPVAELAPGYFGFERTPTRASMGHPAVPTPDTIRDVLFPEHWVFTAPPHYPGRAWFLCLPVPGARALLNTSALPFEGAH